jgi:hypothetical protein
MIALSSGDEIFALRLTDFDEILARHFHGSLNCFGSTGEKVNLAQRPGSPTHQELRQLFGNIGRKKTGMSVGQHIQLGFNRVEYKLIAVAQAGNCSTAGSVEIFFALLVD